MSCASKFAPDDDVSSGHDFSTWIYVPDERDVPCVTKGLPGAECASYDNSGHLLSRALLGFGA
jgi:hypothetical protein